MKKRFFIQVWLLSFALLVFGQDKKTFSPGYATTDSSTVRISTKYEAGSFLHRAIMGSNYRKTWNAPVKLPVFYLSKSGFKIEKLGGGEQTKSLRVKDRNGKLWVLRTVDKDVTPAVPKTLRNTFIKNIVQDMISASYPYSHVLVGKLSQAADIIAPVPELYLVADDAALGAYRSIFANTICSLEQYEPTPDGSDTKETEDVLKKVREADDLVLQKKFLKIRLMDMLVGDWDRHMDQLRWGSVDSTNLTLHYAIPRDRDNALFYAGGVLPLFAKISFMPHITGFTKKSTNIKMLNKKAWGLDRTFLNKLDAKTWQETIKQFQNTITDAVIGEAVNSLPANVVAMDGEMLISKLKSRRDGLLKNGMKYYRFLSRQVTINGSDEEDLFVISRNQELLQVSVYQLKKNGTKLKVYERHLHPSETGVVYLNGLKGNDHFQIGDISGSKIHLRISGDEDKDIYEVAGQIKAKMLDKQAEDIVRTNVPGTLP